MAFSSIVHKSKNMLPGKSVLLEASGFLLLGAGVFLGLACITYDPRDYVGTNFAHPTSVANLAGPLGADLAQIILGSFGVIGLIWPPLLCIWGLCLTFGFRYVPNVKTILGFIGLSVFGAAFLEIQLSLLDVPRPSFGYGGHMGASLGGFVYGNLGLGGASIALVVANCVCLIVTGTLSFSKASAHINFLLHHGIKFSKQLLQSLFQNGKSDDQLIVEALKKEAMASKNLVKKISQQADSHRLKKQKSKGKTASGEALLEEDFENGDDAVSGSDEEINFYYRGGTHDKPSPSLFSKSSKAKERKGEFEKMAKKLTAQLAEFKVQGRITKIVEGPVVTTFEFEPVPGTKLAKITALAQDLTRLLQAKSLRILAPIPGKKVCGFEVPNEQRRSIGFAELAAHRQLKASSVKLPLAMGLDVFGDPIIEDLAKMPHLLVAGSTGSGKSVFMNSIVASLISRHSAKDLRFIMVDPKMVELAVYNGLPHMACPVVSDPSAGAKTKLDALVVEMEERFKKMQLVGARNIESFNDTIKKKRKVEFPEFKGDWQSMPFIVLIIDELADMMMVLGKDVEVPITRLAQKARAAGIHLIIATQRPSAEVVTGLIKANFPTRVAFRVLSGLDSRTILDQNGAEALIGQGDMLYMSAGGVRRLHGAFLSEEEVQKMVKASKAK